MEKRSDMLMDQWVLIEAFKMREAARAQILAGLLTGLTPSPQCNGNLVDVEGNTRCSLADLEELAAEALPDLDYLEGGLWDALKQGAME